MTSGAALDEPSVVKGSEGDDCRNIVEGKFTPEVCQAKTPLPHSKKRQVGIISTSNPPAKVMKSSTEGVRSMKAMSPAHSSPVWLNRLKKVTPTVLGMKEVAQHLLRTKSRNAGSRDASHSILALPTECTYEACTLIPWKKDETISDEDDALREEQLDRRKSISRF